jgi:hypothetical protein
VLRQEQVSYSAIVAEIAVVAVGLVAGLVVPAEHNVGIDTRLGGNAGSIAGMPL